MTETTPNEEPNSEEQERQADLERGEPTPDGVSIPGEGQATEEPESDGEPAE